MNDDERYKELCKPKFEEFKESIDNMREDCNSMKKSFGDSQLQLTSDLGEIKKSVAYLVSKNGNGNGNGSNGRSENVKQMIGEISQKSEESVLVKEVKFFERVWKIVPESFRLPLFVVLLYEFAKLFDSIAGEVKDLCLVLLKLFVK